MLLHLPPFQNPFHSRRVRARPGLPNRWQIRCEQGKRETGATGLEPATSGVTGGRSLSLFSPRSGGASLSKELPGALTDGRDDPQL
jgi:hypothetical protein